VDDLHALDAAGGEKQLMSGAPRLDLHAREAAPVDQSVNNLPSILADREDPPATIRFSGDPEFREKGQQIGPKEAGKGLTKKEPSMQEALEKVGQLRGVRQIAAALAADA
jgi:hypothetical protein